MLVSTTHSPGQHEEKVPECLSEIQDTLGILRFGKVGRLLLVGVAFLIGVEPNFVRPGGHVVGDQRNLNDAWSAVRAWFDGDVPPATLLGVSLLGYENQLAEVDATVAKA